MANSKGFLFFVKSCDKSSEEDCFDMKSRINSLSKVLEDRKSPNDTFDDKSDSSKPLSNNTSKHSRKIRSHDTCEMDMTILEECDRSISDMREHRRNLVISILKGTPSEQSAAAEKLQVVNNSINILIEYESSLFRSITNKKK